MNDTQCVGPREFISDPSWENGEWVWGGKKTVNPQFIAAVVPSFAGASQITLGGSSYCFTVNAEYEDVVSWWLGTLGATGL